MKPLKSTLLPWRALPLLAVLALLTLIALPSYNGTPAALADGNNGAAAAGVLPGGPVVQVAVGLNGPWQEFSFISTAVDATGCFPADPSGLVCTPSSGGNSTFAGVPAWTFTAPPGGATLTVTDAFCKGDRFNVKDFGSSIGNTSAVAIEAGCAGISDPAVTSVDATFSSASFAMAPGSHSITIRPTVSPFGGGAAYFRIAASCTEEPIDPSSVGATIFPGQSSDIGKCITVPGVVQEDVVKTASVSALGAGTDNGNTGSGSGPSAQAVVPLDGNWLEFLFTDTSTDAVDCAGTCTPSSGGNSQDAGSPPWTFTAPATGATLYVTDAFCGGDEFLVSDGGVPIGATPVTANEGCPGTATSDPAIAITQAAYSSTIFKLAPGPHSITIRPTDAPYAGGAAYFRVASGASVTVSMQSNCAAPISTTFTPPSQSAIPGGEVVFTETIAVAGTAPGGKYECDDIVLINGQPLGDPSKATPPAAAEVTAASSGADNGNSGAGSGASVQTAVPVGGTTWSEFSFTDTSTDAVDCAGGCTPSSGGNSQDAGSPPWTFNAPAIGAVLFVADAFCKGDEFDVKDFGSSIGTTSAVATEAGCAGISDPSVTIADSEFSSGAFVMAPGPHSITVRPTDSPFGGGAAYFIVRDVPVATEHKTITVPEGFLTGGGQIYDNAKGKNQKKISFGGNVGFLADGSLLGQWNTIFHNVGPGSATTLDNAKFHSTSIDSLQFANDGGAGPNPPPANANVAHFTATGRLKIGNAAWVDGYKLDVCLADRGEPGSNDSIVITLTNPGGTVVYRSYTSDNFGQPSTAGSCLTNKLDAGNLQIHSGVKS